jgi:hypothetical protein
MRLHKKYSNVTPEYRMPGKGSQYGKAPECPGNQPVKQKEVTNG